MLNFLNSTVLFAAVAALIPLIIHLFSRRRLKVVEFSSLKHLQSMQRRQVRRLKVRQLLLLLLRMLIILAVVLAFARPTTTGGRVGGHASVSAVILVDNSASMNRQVADGNLFEIARKRVEDLLSTFGEADEVALIALNQSLPGDLAPTFSSAAVAAQRLERLAPGYGQADLEGGLEAAMALLDKADNLNKEVFIVSDRQQSSLPDRPVLDTTDVHVYALALPLEGTENCGIVAVDFGGQLLVPGHDFEVTATIANYGVKDRSDVIASLFLDGRRVAQTDATIEAGHEAAVRFTRNLTGGGFHSGYVELSDDLFPGDNRYFFSFRLPERCNVLIVDGDGAGRFMALALVPSESVAQYWSVKEALPEQLSQVNFDDYHVIVLAGAPSLPETYVTRLRSFVRRGKSLLMTYDLSTDISEFNRRWSDVTGVAFDEAAPRDFSRAGYYTLETFKVEHPVFSVFRFEENEPPQIKFFTLPRARALDEGRTLAEFSGGRAALVLSMFGEGRVLTFTGPVLPLYGDLTGHAFFVPFVARMVEYLASDLSSYDVRLFSGESITRSIALKGSFSFSASLEVIAPDSSMFNVPPVEDKGAFQIAPRPTDLPGIYRVSYLGREVDRFAVNVRPDEGNLTEVDFDQFGTALGSQNLHVLEGERDLSAAVAELRFGRELWHIFLWVAVVLLLFEMLLARSAPAPE